MRLQYLFPETSCKRFRHHGAAFPTLARYGSFYFDYLKKVTVLMRFVPFWTCRFMSQACSNQFIEPPMSQKRQSRCRALSPDFRGLLAACVRSLLRSASLRQP